MTISHLWYLRAVGVLLSAAEAFRLSLDREMRLCCVGRLKRVRTALTSLPTCSSVAAAQSLAPPILLFCLRNCFRASRGVSS